jgi:hypothetical protein
VTRREMFLAAGAAALAVMAPATAAEPIELNPVYRYSYATDSWTRVRLYELKPGDVFRLGEVGTFRASSEPKFIESKGQWGIDADAGIDPATNEWVDPHKV